MNPSSNTFIINEVKIRAPDRELAKHSGITSHICVRMQICDIDDDGKACQFYSRLSSGLKRFTVINISTHFLRIGRKFCSIINDFWYQSTLTTLTTFITLNLHIQIQHSFYLLLSWKYYLCSSPATAILASIMYIARAEFCLLEYEWNWKRHYAIFRPRERPFTVKFR